MTVAEYVAAFLKAQGVSHVFTLAGGMIAPMLDALAQQGGLAPDPSGTSPVIIPCRHEQAAGFAAEGMARITGVPGVAMATSGPGATNLLTALASCYFDSTPAVFITGQVPTGEMRQGYERQRGFQETDIVSMARPVTKTAIQIRHVEAVGILLHDAFISPFEDGRALCSSTFPLTCSGGRCPSRRSLPRGQFENHRGSTSLPSSMLSVARSARSSSSVVAPPRSRIELRSESCSAT